MTGRNGSHTTLGQVDRETPRQVLFRSVFGPDGSRVDTSMHSCAGPAANPGLPALGVTWAVQGSELPVHVPPGLPVPVVDVDRCLRVSVPNHLSGVAQATVPDTWTFPEGRIVPLPSRVTPMMATRSSGPMSQRWAWGRATPRWSVAGGGQAGSPAFMAGLPTVRLVHGKGTGALRKAVRTLLSAHPLVASFRDGEPSEGGGGATVAALKVG